MSQEDLSERLSGIVTDWDALRDAHGEASTARAAQQVLLVRYGPAIRRYLSRVANDPDTADELFQEFGMAVVEGKLKSADPDRGRFRDYVKGVLRHLVAKFYTKQKAQPVGAKSSALHAVAAPEPTEAKLDEAWRDNLLARAWGALAEANRLAYDVLRFRSENPNVPSQELAPQLQAKLGKPFTPESVRQTIHRARKQFALLLVTEVGQSLANPTPDEVSAELAELGLLEYCRPALEG